MIQADATREPGGGARGEPRSAPEVALRERELVERLGWFVEVRWVFLVALVLGIVALAFGFRMEFPIRSASFVAAAIASYNALFAFHDRFVRHGGVPGLRASRIEAGLQIGLDLLALTWLLHYAGGAENPFMCFYIFHVIVGSMLLSRREAWMVGLFASALFVALVLLEYRAVIPHYHPPGFTGNLYRQLPYLAVVCAALLATLFSTIAITSSIVESLREGERKLVDTRAELVAKTRDLERAYATLTDKQQQLVHTEKQASLGQLVAGIAHEINNPIQFIHGNMAILSEAFSDALPVLDERSARDPRLRIARLEYPYFREHLPVLLKDMADGTGRIEAIVRDLKTFARKDEGRLDEEVDLNEAVRTSMRLLHASLKKLEVTEDLAPDLPRVRGSTTQLQQVVVNVLQNVVDALAGRATPRVAVRTRPEDGGAEVRLSISDNGPGIPPEVRARIFDPFFTTKQRAGGTGLGLAITYGIVQQHHGRIEVDTAVGHGTTFHFLLPVAGREGA